MCAARLHGFKKPLVLEEVPAKSVSGGSCLGKDGRSRGMLF
jgi:hypothetical protein